MKWNPRERQETSDKKGYPVALSNILSTFVMYAGNKRGLDVDGSGYETLVQQNLSTFIRK